MDNINLEIDDLINHTNSLSWSDSPPLLSSPSPNPSNLPSLTLMGKVISLIPISKVIIKNNISLAWKFLISLTTEDREDDLMVFTFDNLEDLMRVLENSPWNIKGSPLFLKKWSLSESIKDIDFSTGAFWVQVHDLPLEMITPENAFSIGSSLGELLEVDNAENNKPSRKSFLRFRVLIKLHHPLTPGFTHHYPPKAPTWVQYKYERLSEYCYFCGRLGHLSYACPVADRPPAHGRYGVILKASPLKFTWVVNLIPAHKPLARMIEPVVEVPLAVSNSASTESNQPS
ncbi:uncharacterized protein LOC132177932 [Corylus avellana]|uniref:uncharacterized protein LOC132177932 n=1 Tax=Corylus avellana TaxID=13451 RepID=UPI00286A7E99|nr:uncharacterized protein LOC132177932 [Corylus avellana]